MLGVWGFAKLMEIWCSNRNRRFMEVNDGLLVQNFNGGLGLLLLCATQSLHTSLALGSTIRDASNVVRCNASFFFSFFVSLMARENSFSYTKNIHKL